MSAVIWVHMDSLSREHPVFDRAPSGARAIYVWDADDMAKRDWSLKRCVFILECLAEMDVDLIAGDPVSVLDGLNVDTIYVARTPDPSLRAAIKTLETETQIVKAVPFATVPERTSMARFFRYWNKVRKSALTPSAQAVPADTPSSQIGAS